MFKTGWPLSNSRWQVAHSMAIQPLRSKQTKPHAGQEGHAMGKLELNFEPENSDVREG
jgi:hypothetical protein